MHHKLIIRGIKGIIPGGVSEHDFSTASEIDEFSAKELLQIFIQNGIGILDERDIIGFLGEFACCELLKIDWENNIRDRKSVV